MVEQLIQVRMCEFIASDDLCTALRTTSLGSCVAIALYDKAARIAGLAHCLLDRQARFGAHTAPGRCADTAIPALIHAMVSLGAHSERLQAWLAGGGNMFDCPDPIYDVGLWNLEAARETLDRLRIAIVAEDVGGTVSRRLQLSVETGSVKVLRPTGITEVL